MGGRLEPGSPRERAFKVIHAWACIMHAQTYSEPIFSTLFAMGQERCGIVYCSVIVVEMFALWVCLQGTTDATMKAVRQVKTVFIIFIAFVCCWSPYIVVLLYDSSDSLPLPVHLYASMLAHLHASLNFAIYGLMNRNLRSGFAAHVSACCRRVAACSAVSGSASAATAACSYSCAAQRSSTGRRPGHGTAVPANRPPAAGEYHQLHGFSDHSGRSMRRGRRPITSVCIIDERECHSSIVPCN